MTPVRRRLCLAAFVALTAAACGGSAPPTTEVAERGSETEPGGAAAAGSGSSAEGASADGATAEASSAGEKGGAGSGSGGGGDGAGDKERSGKPGDKGGDGGSGGGGNDRRAREERILRPGDRGDRVLALQRSLRKLGYWLGHPDGTYGTLTEQAVLAFQGIERIGRDGAAGPETFGALRTAKRPSPRSTGGDLIEIDEDRGALFVVRDGVTQWVFHTSTGTDEPYSHPSGQTFSADTPDGRWTVSWGFDGWREGPLGEMWRPRYFHADGIAIHGFESVPAYPASHGCARVSIAAMNTIWERDLAPLGSTVWVY